MCQTKIPSLLLPSSIEPSLHLVQEKWSTISQSPRMPQSNKNLVLQNSLPSELSNVRHIAYVLINEKLQSLAFIFFQIAHKLCFKALKRMVNCR